MTTFVISDIEIDKFMKGNLPKIPENTVITIDAQKLNEFMEQVRKNFGSISQNQFDWIQDIIPKLDDKSRVNGHSLADHISNMFRSGFKHEQRNDLICHLRKDSVTQFYGIECFGGDAIKQMNADVFRGMNTKQISSLLQSSSVKFLTDEQKSVIIANNNISSELKKKVTPTTSTAVVTPLPSEAPVIINLDKKPNETVILETFDQKSDQQGGIFSLSTPRENKSRNNILPPLFENRKVGNSDVASPNLSSTRNNKILSLELSSPKTGKTLSSTKKSQKRRTNYVIRKKNDDLDEMSLYFKSPQNSAKGGQDEELATETENSIIEKIAEHVHLMESVRDIDFPLENDNLDADGIEISADCFVHFFLGTSDEVAERCADSHAKLSNYLDDDKLDVSALFGTNDEERTLTDSLAKAREIYSFIVAVVKKTTEDEFRRADVDKKHIVFKRIEDMIIEYFNFTHKFMQKHRVIDGKIVNAAEDMLYLYTNVINYHTNLGKDLGSLNGTYADLVAVVNNNIELYNGLQQGVIVGSENVNLTSDMSSTVESLVNRMAELKEQQDALNENIKLINNESVRAGQNASDTMKTFVASLQ
jgi:hypothetical protein